jgi:hypothetical protein
MRKPQSRPERDDYGTSQTSIRRHPQDRLYSINAERRFGIGRRAFLIRTDDGNVLWDCVGLIDDATIANVKEVGGIADIAISHPPYYTAMVEWSRAFGGAPIHLHEAEWPWVMRPDPCIRSWQGEAQALRGGLKLVRTGGHLEGYQMLHWPAGAGGKGTPLVGDQPQICIGPKRVTFMYSYPNDIPLNDSQIRRIVECLDPLPFDRIYGASSTRGKGTISTHGKEIVRRSADRDLRAIQG